LFAGLTAWGFFATGVNTGIGALLGSGPLLKKIYFPAYAPVLGSLVAVGIQSAIEVGLVLVVVALFGNIGWTWLLVPFWAGIFFVFVAALSMTLAVANVFFRDLAHLVAVFLQLLFYATPILYQDTLVLNPTAHRLLMSNPLSQFVDLFRDNVYGLTAGSWKSWLYIVAWAIGMVAVASWTYRRFGRDLSEQL
jgi:ABC-type polysaccharide/polyol phosphate export permease